MPAPTNETKTTATLANQSKSGAQAGYGVSRFGIGRFGETGGTTLTNETKN